MDARKLIGWNLRRVRVAKGLSQERLALEANIDRAYVGRVERGGENVTVDTLQALSQVLGVPIGELFRAVAEGAPLLPTLRAGRKAKGQSTAGHGDG